MSKHPFAPGDVVVCVDAQPCEEGYAPPELTEGAHYTIFEVGFDQFDNPGVFLDELESRGFAGGYLAYRFRHIDKADDTFTEQMRALKPQRGKVPA